MEITNVGYEKEVCRYLNLPSIPKKKWDKESSFVKGIAITRLANDYFAYAICTYDKEIDDAPRITKSFANETFFGIEEIFIVPDYMNTEVDSFDLDEEGKKRAQELIEEAKDIANEGEVEEEMRVMNELPEWIFKEITNVEEAKAWLSSYNKKNHIKGRIPNDEDTIKMRLLNIYSQMKNKK